MIIINNIIWYNSQNIYIIIIMIYYSDMTFCVCNADGKL